MSYYIYKLQIGKYWYIGSSYQTNRLKGHKHDCFNPNRKNYNSNVYKKIRELTIKENFYSSVQEIKIEENVSENNKADREDFYIDLSNQYCLNTKRENQNRNINGISNPIYNLNNTNFSCYLCGSKMTKMTKSNYNIHCKTLKHLRNNMLYGVE